VFAPAFSAVTGVMVVAAGGLAGAVIGLALWIRVLRGSPQLQEVLAVTPEGVPLPDVVEELMAGEVRPPTEPLQ